MQRSDSSSFGQSLPPFWGGVITVRRRVRVPPPHLTLHSLQSPNSLTTQSTGTGHGWVLHSRVSVNGGHSLPPLEGGVTMTPVRDCFPPPHGSLQGPKSGNLTTQSTGIGHGMIMQGRVSSSAGQAAPPFDAGVTTVRVRFWVPGPQAALQVLQSVKALTLQSTGAAQALLKQFWPAAQQVPLHCGRSSQQALPAMQRPPPHDFCPGQH